MQLRSLLEADPLLEKMMVTKLDSTLQEVWDDATRKKKDTMRRVVHLTLIYEETV